VYGVDTKNEDKWAKEVAMMFGNNMEHLFTALLHKYKDGRYVNTHSFSLFFSLSLFLNYYYRYIKKFIHDILNKTSELLNTPMHGLIILEAAQLSKHQFKIISSLSRQGFQEKDDQYTRLHLKPYHIPLPAFFPAYAPTMVLFKVLTAATELPLQKQVIEESTGVGGAMKRTGVALERYIHFILFYFLFFSFFSNFSLNLIIYRSRA
jgi:hypothetical protein